MTKPSIGVTIICKDELESLKRLLPQLSKFDQVVIAHNGNDLSVSKYLKRLNKPYEYHHFDWRPEPVNEDTNDWGFSYARNFSFSKLKTDYALWIDSDDSVVRIKDGSPVALTPEQTAAVFRNLAEKAPDIDHWMLDYLYAFDDDGNCVVTSTRERFVKLATGYTWIYPIHENCTPSRKPNWTNVGDVKILHRPRLDTREESANTRNLRMLQLWYDQLKEYGNSHPDIVRARLLIGDSLRIQERYDDAARWLYTEFIKNHPDANSLERWQAWSFIAACHMMTGRLHEAKLASLQCIEIRPNLPDGYYNLAQVKALADADPRDILELVEKGDTCDRPPRMVMQNPLDYTFTPYLLKAQSYYELGEWEKGLFEANKAVALKPTDQRALNLRANLAEKVRTDNSVEAAKALYQFLRDFDENEKAAKLYDTLPYVAQNNEEVKALAASAMDRIRHMWSDEDYIKLYAGNTHWTPVADQYIEAGLPPGQDRFEYVLSRLKAALPNGGRILDVGCSDGFHSLLYAKHGYEVVGVDLDARCVAIANDRAERWGLAAKFIKAFFEKVDPMRAADPFDSSRSWYRNFDAVVCSEVIEHVQNPAELLDSLGECAKDGAPIIVTTPDGAFDKGEIPEGGGMEETEINLSGHVRVFTQETFEALIRSNRAYRVVEAHFLPFSEAYREKQGWQVGEYRREDRPEGKIIRIFCGNPVEPFSPRSLETGIGGSETAVIHMARHWADAGQRVVVYNNEQGVFDGVLYRKSEDFDPKHESDILIAWRGWGPFMEERPNAKTTVVWTHDIHYPFDIPEEYLLRVDKVAVLSKFHAEWMLGKHPNLKDKLWITRNGIDIQRYQGEIHKVPHSYFYSSSPDRGLNELLMAWPAVKAAIPDATLHVCYGFANAIRMSKMAGRGGIANDMEKMHAALLKMDGVVFHDRINQQELAQLQMTCEAWLYPHQGDEFGGFLETSCITKFEAMAACAIPFTRLNGALPESLPHCIEWTKDTTVDDIVATLSNIDDHWSPAKTSDNRRVALAWTWKSLAAEWLEELTAPMPELVEV